MTHAKLTKVTYRVIAPTEIESGLGISTYEAYAENVETLLVQLREAERRGEVTEITVEE